MCICSIWSCAIFGSIAPRCAASAPVVPTAMTRAASMILPRDINSSSNQVGLGLPGGGVRQDLAEGLCGKLVREIPEVGPVRILVVAARVDVAAHLGHDAPHDPSLDEVVLGVGQSPGH